VFSGSPNANGIYSIGADGAIGVEERRVEVAFDTVSGLSDPLEFRLRKRLPNRIGVHDAELRWYARSPAESPYSGQIGNSPHRFYTTWAAMTLNLRQGLQRWTYKPIVEWTCEWASGLDDEKDICDAIMAGLTESNLRYGHRVRGEDAVRSFLLNGGGMCGEWYRVFQHMAHCQGVYVHRRAFLVDWRHDANGEARWCAQVIRRGGLNQLEPTHPESDFHDNDAGYPIETQVPLVIRRERCYQFFGSPVSGVLVDGHCINFLVYCGRLYLYDACFGLGPIEIDSPLPTPDLNVAKGGNDLASFKTRYLDIAVDYMLGSLYNGPDFHRCMHPSVGILGGNGMTVKTRLITDSVNGSDGVTFFWSD